MDTVPVTGAQVLELRRVHRSWGARRIVFELGRPGIDPVPSESGVYRALVRAGLIEPAGGGAGREEWRQRSRRTVQTPLDGCGGRVPAG